MYRRNLSVALALLLVVSMCDARSKWLKSASLRNETEEEKIRCPSKIMFQGHGCSVFCYTGWNEENLLCEEGERCMCPETHCWWGNSCKWMIPQMCNRTEHGKPVECANWVPEGGWPHGAPYRYSQIGPSQSVDEDEQMADDRDDIE